MQYLFIIISVKFFAYSSSYSYPCPTAISGGTRKRRLGIGEHALVSGCLEHWTIQL